MILDVYVYIYSVYNKEHFLNNKVSFCLDYPISLLPGISVKSNEPQLYDMVCLKPQRLVHVSILSITLSNDNKFACWLIQLVDGKRIGALNDLRQ